MKSRHIPYTYMYTCVWVCTVNTHVCTYLYMYVWCVCVHVCTHLSMCGHVCVLCARVCAHLYMFVCGSVCMHVLLQGCRLTNNNACAEVMMLLPSPHFLLLFWHWFLQMGSPRCLTTAPVASSLPWWYALLPSCMEIATRTQAAGPA